MNPAIFAACAAARLTKGALLRLDEQPTETGFAKAQAAARRRAVRRSDQKSGSVASVHVPKVRPPHAGSRCLGACPPCESGEACPADCGVNTSHFGGERQNLLFGAGGEEHLEWRINE